MDPSDFDLILFHQCAGVNGRVHPETKEVSTAIITGGISREYGRWLSRTILFKILYNVCFLYLYSTAKDRICHEVRDYCVERIHMYS